MTQPTFKERAEKEAIKDAEAIILSNLVFVRGAAWARRETIEEAIRLLEGRYGAACTKTIRALLEDK